MSFDCKYKVKNNQCHRLKKECSPGEKGCILHGKYDFPLKENKDKGKKESTD
jgi:hypothetical protein